MGVFTSSLLKEYDIVVGFDKIELKGFKTFDKIDEFLQNDIEVVIDFSNSNLAKDVLIDCINRKIKVITGTSNIPNIKEISKLAYDNKVSFVYLENFSKGIKDLVGVLDKFNCDQIEIIEEHYHTKKDLSQTAISLGKIVDVNESDINFIRSIKKESNHYIKMYYENEEILIIHKCLNINAYKEILLNEYNNIISNDFYFKCGIINNKTQ